MFPLYWTARQRKSWRTVDRDTLRHDSPLGYGEIPASATADQLFAMYNRTVRDITDQFAPECRAICRNNCLWLECRYRRTHAAADGQALTAAQRHRLTVFKDKRDRYWSDHIADETGSPVKLWNTMNAILQREERTADDVAPTPYDADAFLRYFSEKVKSVRAATASHPLLVFNSTAEVLLSTLRPCSEDEVRGLITASPTKSCALDPIPTFLLKEMVDVLLPYVTAMINASLREGRLPSSHRHAVVTPLLKSSRLDADKRKNYRPVSNLSFISKLTERAVSTQIVSHLNDDLSATFDCVYWDILLSDCAQSSALWEQYSDGSRHSCKTEHSKSSTGGAYQKYFSYSFEYHKGLF